MVHGFYYLCTSSPVCHTCFFWPGSRLKKVFAEENGVDLHVLTGGIAHADYKSLCSQWHKKIGSDAICNRPPQISRKDALVAFAASEEAGFKDGMSINC